MRPSRGKRDRGPRTNRKITAAEVRLVGADGEMVGVVKLEEALAAARAAKLDLVEVSPNAEPPVCKILDYGRYKYEQKVKAKEAKKKQKKVHLKEIKLRPNIDPNDLTTKLNQVRKFLEDGDKVKFTLRFMWFRKLIDIFCRVIRYNHQERV